MLRGLAPYKDLLDQKPPGIYLIDAVTLLLLGRSSIAFRLMELLWILGASFACGKICESFAKKTGFWIAFCFCGILSSSAYWGMPERGQVEFFQNTLAAFGVWFVIRYWDTNRNWNLFLSGFCLAGDCWLKPQAAILSVSIALLLVTSLLRNPKTAISAALVMLAGVLSVSLPILLWMWQAGSLPAFYKMMFVMNATYIHKTASAGMPVAFQLVWRYYFSPVSLIFSILMTAGGLYWLICSVAAERRKYFWIGLMFLSWWFSGFLQFVSGHYLFRYHSIVLLPAFAVIFTAGCAAGIEYMQRIRDKIAPFLYHGSLIAGAFTLISIFGINTRFVDEIHITANWLLGRITTQTVYSQFGRHSHYYNFLLQKETAEFVKENSSPSDTVHVIGRAGAFYLYVDRMPASRFLVSSSEFDQRNPYHIAVRDEILRDYQTRKPRFIIIRLDDYFPWFGFLPSGVVLKRDPVMGAYITGNYHVVRNINNSLLVVERNPEDSPR